MAGNSVLGVSTDVRDAVRHVAEMKMVHLRDLASEALLAHPEIFEAFCRILKDRGEDTSHLKRTDYRPPVVDDYMGGP